jgi:hypothetical protein
VGNCYLAFTGQQGAQEGRGINPPRPLAFAFENMKYFTKEIWAGWQSSDNKVQSEADRAWETALARYKRQQHKLMPRLSKNAQIFFKKHSLHDGLLLSACIGDSLRHISLKKPYRHRTTVELTILDAWPKYIYRLTYKGIKSIKVHSDNSLFPLKESLFGDWGYDELIPSGRNHFQHNILFQTGTEISIVFQEFKYKRERFSNNSLQRMAYSPR